MWTPDEVLEAVAEFDDCDDVVQFPDLHDALIGYVQPIGLGYKTILIYSASKAMKVLMERDGMTHLEALEWLSTNTEGGYVGPHTPFVMYDEHI